MIVCFSSPVKKSVKVVFFLDINVYCVYVYSACVYVRGGGILDKKETRAKNKADETLHSANTQIVRARVDIGEEDEEEQKEL